VNSLCALATEEEILKGSQQRLGRVTVTVSYSRMFFTAKQSIYHPARASSDVASSLAPSTCCRPAPVGAWSARHIVLRLQAARCSIGPSKSLGRSCGPGGSGGGAHPQQLPAARSHPGRNVRAAADAEMMEYHCSASVAVPPMA
jgi:hypothetical protein